MYIKNLNEILSKKDLSKDSSHCIGILVEKIKQSLEKKYIKPTLEYGSPIVSLEENYYALGYDNNEITLSAKYTRYIDDKTILRTQMSSNIPSLLKQYKGSETLYMCPGQVYRRDVKDKTHIGEPHQLDIWYITSQPQTRADLLALVQIIISVIEKEKKEKITWRYNETNHHYTDEGIEVEIYYKDNWLEILECGLIAKSLLKRNNLEKYSGLALGLGLDRLAMIVKDITDIRVLLSDDIRVKSQLSNLKPYKEVSKQPSTKRDLSITVDINKTIEDITEEISSLDCYDLIESIELLNETSYEELLPAAIEKLGINQNQKNILLRLTLRDLTTTISKEKANLIYTKIYALIHRGTNGYYI